MAVAYPPLRGTVVRGTVTNVGSWIDRDYIAFYGSVFGGVPRRPSDRDYWMTYPGFTKVRAGIERVLWRRVSGSFDIENLFYDQAFEPDNVTPPAPRTFTLALRAAF